MIGAYPFRVGDEIRVSVRASVTVPVKLFARVRYVDGGDDLVEIDITHSAGDRTNELKRSSDLFKKAGWVEHLTVDTTLNNARGRFYMMVAINKKPHHFPIAAGYVDIPHVPLGEFEPAISGSGHLFWSTLADDVVPVAVGTFPLAVANARRIIWGFIWYYHCSSDVASRFVTSLIEDVGLGQPTGMTSGANTRPWQNSALTLTADEEGTIYVMGGQGKGPGYSATIDDGTLAVEDTSTNPIPFPMLVDENDNIDLILRATDFEAADRHSAYMLVEEWISP